MKCPITIFFHCKKCLDELPKDQSPKDYARVQVGIDGNQDELVIWCNRHDEPITVMGTVEEDDQDSPDPAN